MPLIAGIDYSISGGGSVVNGPYTLNNNQVTPSVLFSYSWSGSQNIIIEFSIQRGSINEVGRLFISTDGTTISTAGDNTETSDSGIILSTALSGTNVEILYTSNNISQSGQFWYSMRKISN